MELTYLPPDPNHPYGGRWQATADGRDLGVGANPESALADLVAAMERGAAAERRNHRNLAHAQYEEFIKRAKEAREQGDHRRELAMLYAADTTKARFRL